jgi:hypothetical protein
MTWAHPSCVPRWVYVQKGTSTQLAGLLCCAAAIAAIAVYLLVHRLASFAFPIPQGDEATFLWQAVAFAKGNTLFAPELHGERSIMWMPPGYMIFLGLIFKITGFSLTIARTISMLFTIGAFVAMLLIGWQLRSREAIVVLMSLFLLNKFFIVTGNVARMESLVLLLTCCGYLLIAARFYVKGLALLLITPLIHPNGMYMFSFALLFVVLRVGLADVKKSFCLSDLLAVAVAIAAWLAYAYYVQGHWEDFRLDMGYQFARKASRDIVGTFLSSKQELGVGAAVLVMLVLSIRGDPKPALVAFLALGAWTIQRIGLEMWYSIYDAIVILLVSILVLHFADDLLDRLPVHRITVRRVIRALVLVAVIVCNIRIGMVESPSGYPWKMTWCGMRIQRDVPYINESDIQKIRSFIISQKNAARPPLIVEFWPVGDALFFHDIEDKSLTMRFPRFDSRALDLSVTHVSRYVPAWQEQAMIAQLRRSGLDQSDSRGLIHERDETEKWYAGKPFYRQ